MKHLHYQRFPTRFIYAVFASFLLSNAGFAQPLIPTIPAPDSPSDSSSGLNAQPYAGSASNPQHDPTQTLTPEQHLAKSKKNLKAIKAQVERFTRAQLTNDTEMIIERNALKIRSEFHNGLIRTEFKARKNGDLLLRVKIPF